MVVLSLLKLSSICCRDVEAAAPPSGCTTLTWYTLVSSVCTVIDVGDQCISVGVGAKKAGPTTNVYSSFILRRIMAQSTPDANSLGATYTSSSDPRENGNNEVPRKVIKRKPLSSRIFRL